LAHRFATSNRIVAGQRAVIRGCRDERVSKGLAATIALTVVTINGRVQDAPPAKIVSFARIERIS
jgi:hypothetical protein